jgi:hypothetical protein
MKHDSVKDNVEKRPAYLWDDELKALAKKVAEAMEENEREDESRRNKK